GHTTNAYILIVYVAFWPQPARQWTVSEDDWRAMRGIYRFSGRITLKNFENKPPKEGVYVTLQSCNVNSNDEHRCRGTDCCEQNLDEEGTAFQDLWFSYHCEKMHDLPQKYPSVFTTYSCRNKKIHALGPIEI
uniref:Uncharacterized protein n=1 Tax=Romanomermis culicivorax TaxID=13658 RepID=A0A915HTD7_ROMCU